MHSFHMLSYMLGERDRDMETDCKRVYLFVQRLRSRYYCVVKAVCFDFSPLSYFLGSQTRATKQCSCHCWRKLLILLSAAWSAQTGDWWLMGDWGVHRDQRVCYATVGRCKSVVVYKVCVDIGRNINKPKVFETLECNCSRNVSATDITDTTNCVAFWVEVFRYFSKQSDKVFAWQTII